MSIITLTTDWGLKDYYRAAVIGKIISYNKDVKIIDISHNITPYSSIEASYVLQNCYNNFPKGSIHIIGVDTIASSEKPHTLVKCNEHYFIGADNGIFSLLFKNEDKIELIVEIDIIQDSDYFTFPVRDVFVKAAFHIIENQPLEDLGNIKDKFREALHYKPTNEPKAINGVVTYIDNYGNAITNLSLKKLQNKLTNTFTIIVGKDRINKICKSYDEVAENEIIAIFSSNGHLQIAINKANAANLLGLHLNTQIRIEFENK